MSDNQSLVERLNQHPFLRGLPLAYLDFIAQHAHEAHFDTDQHLMLEGETADKFHLICSGEVVLKTFLSPSEGFATIQYLGRGDIVGWSWLIPPHHWHFCAFATQPTEVIILDGAQLREKCEADSDFGYELQKRLSLIIGKRLRMTRKQLHQSRDNLTS